MTISIIMKKVHLTITFGISNHSRNDEIEDVIRKADRALYSGKHKGRNRVEVFE